MCQNGIAYGIANSVLPDSGMGVAGFGTMAREIAEDTCLYMDEYAIERVEDAVSASFQQRVKPLLRYYFQAPSAANRSVEELQLLWNLPLEDFAEKAVARCAAIVCFGESAALFEEALASAAASSSKRDSDAT